MAKYKLVKTKYDLPIETAILVPSTNSSQEYIGDAKFKQRIREVRTYLAKKYGGYTSVKAIGGYYSNDRKEVIKEPVVKVTAFAERKKWEKYKPIVIKKVYAWSKRWGQESIGYEEEGDLHYYGYERVRVN